MTDLVVYVDEFTQNANWTKRSWDLPRTSDELIAQYGLEWWDVLSRLDCWVGVPDEVLALVPVHERFELMRHRYDMTLVVKHEEHDQRSHGNWARGVVRTWDLGGVVRIKDGTEEGNYRYRYRNLTNGKWGEEFETSVVGDHELWLLHGFLGAPDYQFSSDDLVDYGQQSMVNIWGFWEGNFVMRTMSAEIMGIAANPRGGEEFDEEQLEDMKNGMRHGFALTFLPSVHGMMAAIKESEPTDFEVSRATMVRGNSPLLGLQVGEEMTLPLSGFTGNSRTLSLFRRGGDFGDALARQIEDEEIISAGPPREVIFRLERGARVVMPPDGWEDTIVDVDLIIERGEEVLPLEVVTQGKFVITGRETNADGDVVYRIRHRQFFDWETGGYKDVG